MTKMQDNLYGVNKKKLSHLLYRLRVLLPCLLGVVDLSPAHKCMKLDPQQVVWQRESDAASLAGSEPPVDNGDVLLQDVAESFGIDPDWFEVPNDWSLCAD